MAVIVEQGCSANKENTCSLEVATERVVCGNIELVAMSKNILLLVKSHFKSELQDLGHRVVALAFEGEFDRARSDAWSFGGCDGVFRDQASIFEILEQVKPFQPDCVIYHDDSCPYIRVSQFDKCPVPAVFYSVDVHIHGTWHSYVSGMFDHTFVAQRDYLSSFRSQTSSVSWLPLWAPRVVEPALAKDIRVCFRGTLALPQRQQRLDFLKAVAEGVPLDYAQGDFEPAFTRAEIVLNEQIRDDINFRVFESIMCGACLVTPSSSNGLDMLFVDGEHLVTYRPHDPLDAIDKLRALLEDPERCRRIAAAGREHLMARHLAKHRAQEVEALLRSLSVTRNPGHAQMALYNSARWWGTVHGRFDQAPTQVVQHLLMQLEEIATSDAPMSDETVFVCAELAAASWSGESGSRLCDILTHLGLRSDRHSQALGLISICARAQCEGSGAAEVREIVEIFHNLRQASPFRIFDRPIAQ